jgi:drug/metabolite transporter (DMT)-like permease
MAISLPVALAVLGAALLHASWNVLVKASADKQLDTVAVAAGAGTLSLAAALVLPWPDPASWPWFMASALVHIGYFATLSGAYRWGDMSFAYPIMRGGGPALVSLVSVLLLGETLPWQGVAGVALICIGVLAFASSPPSDPAAMRRSLRFALGNAALIATYTLIDAHGARLSGAPVSYTLWFFVVTGVVVSIAGALQRGRAVPAYLTQNWKRAAVAGACTVGSYSVALWAMTQAPIALVAALRETSVVFGAILAALLLGERLTRRRLAASGVVLGGLVLLRL